MALPLVFFLSNSKETRDHNVVDRVVVFVSAPVQWMVVGALDAVSTVWQRYVALVDLQADNEALTAENNALEMRLTRLEEARLENERLRLLIGMKERAPEVRMLFAAVISTSPTPLFRSLRIDRGVDDGVRLGAAVVNHDGVVGRIAALTDSYADVMLLVDANNSTDVLVQRTRARARVRGTGSDKHLGVQVEYLARTADVEPGDVLITSGTGDVFPKGLSIGTIMAVERGAFGLYQHATVEPSVDFSRIESVMVILDGWKSGTSFEDAAPADSLSGPLLDESAMSEGQDDATAAAASAAPAAAGASSAPPPAPLEGPAPVTAPGGVAPPQ